MRNPVHVSHAFSPVIVERRRQADRRSGWRGGRRDTDWTTRPTGALESLEGARPPDSAWHRWLAASVPAMSLRGRHA